MSHYKQGFPPERDGETGLRGLKLLKGSSEMIQETLRPPRGSSNPGYPVKIYLLHPPLGARGSDTSGITPRAHIQSLLCQCAFDRCVDTEGWF